MVLAFALLMVSAPCLALDLKIGGDGSGGKILGFVDTNRNVFLAKDIADVTTYSFDLKTGERIYSDEIKSILIEKDFKTVERVIESSRLERAFEKVSSGGDSGGG